MYYGLVHFPNINTELIDRVRKKYDPTVDMIKPHITVMFPIPDEIDEIELIDHISSILNKWKAFPIQIRGLKISWDHWLFLVLEQGNDDVVRLNRDIYSGMLAKYQREDMEFIPHISLGLFTEHNDNYDYNDPKKMNLDSHKYAVALKEVESLNLDFHTDFAKLQLLKINDMFTSISKVQEFLLNQGA
jgi:2'-5' RNA ligase